MVQKCFLLMKLLEKTQEIRIIVLCEAPRQKVTSYKFDILLHEVMKKFKKDF